MRISFLPAVVLVVVASAAGHLAAVEDADRSWRWVPLIQDGKVSPGWGQVGWGGFVVDGDVVCTAPDEKGLGLLVYTKERLGNCQIRVVYRPKDAKANAGVFVRMDDGILGWVGKDSLAVRREVNGKLSPAMLEKMKEASETEQGAWYAVHHGYEVQMCDTGDALHRTGAVYSLAPAAPTPQKPYDQWRTMTITLDGSRVRIEQDGQLLATFDESSTDNPPRKNWTEPKRDPKRPEAGYIGLQNHDPGDIVYFKEVSVRGLEKRP